MTELSNKKRERHDAQILTTKSHAKSVNEPRLGEEIRMNPIMKDLILMDMQMDPTYKMV